MYKLFLCLLIIGGINWGLVGLLSFDLVAYIFGSAASIMARIVYVLVGISALAVRGMSLMGEKDM